MSDFLNFISSDDDDAAEARTQIGTLIARAVKVGVEAANRRQTRSSSRVLDTDGFTPVVPVTSPFNGTSTINVGVEKFLMPDDWIAASIVIENHLQGPILVFPGDINQDVGTIVGRVPPNAICMVNSGTGKCFPTPPGCKYISVLFPQTANDDGGMVAQDLFSYRGWISVTMAEAELAYGVFPLSSAAGIDRINAPAWALPVQLVNPAGNAFYGEEGGTSTLAIAAGQAANTTVKSTAGKLWKVIVTTSGANPMVFRDGAAGTIIGALPANAAVGPYEFASSAATAIVAIGNAGNPAVTVTFD